MKTLKIKCKSPYGVMIAPSSSEYLEIALAGVEKVLIVADENVFRAYGNAIKKTIRKTCQQVYTFIYPAGESGRTKHVSDKLLILMTELNINSTDCVIAFGGRSSASLAGYVCSIFKGGVPYVFLPTTLRAMLSPVTDGKVGVDFLGHKQLLSLINYPVAVIVDTDYLSTLSEDCLKDGYAEMMRLGIMGDGKIIEQMKSPSPDMEWLIYSALIVKQKTKRAILGLKSKKAFALDFSSVAEKISLSKISYDKLVAFGIITAIDTAMALGVSYGLEEPMLELFNKYGIKWDVGVTINKLWQALSEQSGKKVNLVLPKKLGKTKVVKMTKEKIKENF